jgi:hypothetical protein
MPFIDSTPEMDVPLYRSPTETVADYRYDEVRRVVPQNHSIECPDIPF